MSKKNNEFEDIENIIQLNDYESFEKIKEYIKKYYIPKSKIASKLTHEFSYVLGEDEEDFIKENKESFIKMIKIKILTELLLEDDL